MKLNMFRTTCRPLSGAWNCTSSLWFYVEGCWTCGCWTLSSNHTSRGPGSVVGIATGYWLDGPGIESRWGRDFPHLSRPTLGPPSLLYNGFLAVNSGRNMTLSPHPLLVPWSWKSRAMPLSAPPMDRTACTEPQSLYKGDLYLYIIRISSSVCFKNKLWTWGWPEKSRNM
jgi:hypothetical protein